MMLKSLINKLLGKHDVEPVKAPVVPVAVQKEPYVLAAALTAEGTLYVKMHAEPLSYTLGMLMDHPRTICYIVRNVAAWMAVVYHKDSEMLLRVAHHGGDPAPHPFVPMQGEGVVPTIETKFVADLSLFEAAQMAYTVFEAHKSLGELGDEVEGFRKTFLFWQDVWNVLPEHAKMSVMYEAGGDVVN